MKIFWSWQSDTPGKTGRHFVRQAILSAIKKLKQNEDVEEPIEREIKKSVHIDHDRQGISGSPRLMDTILRKIDDSTVFIGDVTPVARIRGVRKDGNERPEKRIMNPNVAIELGYALKSVSEFNVLMVLNSHYGARKYLPFDIQGNAGPITYNLAPDATPGEISTEASKLEAQLVQALQEFLKKATAEKKAHDFNRTPSTTTRAVFFSNSEPLATFGVEGIDLENFFMPENAGFYLRMIPQYSVGRPLAKAFLLKVLRQGEIETFSNNTDGGGTSVTNNYGAAAIDIRDHRNKILRSITQAFPNGELWGFAPWALRDTGYGRIIPWLAVERVVKRSLPRYLAYAERIGLEVPLTLEFGAVGLEDFSLTWDQNPDNRLGPIRDSEWVVSIDLNEISQDSQSAALARLFDGFVRVTGFDRPQI